MSSQGEPFDDKLDNSTSVHLPTGQPDTEQCDSTPEDKVSSQERSGSDSCINRSISSVDQSDRINCDDDDETNTADTQQPSSDDRHLDNSESLPPYSQRQEDEETTVSSRNQTDKQEAEVSLSPADFNLEDEIHLEHKEDTPLLDNNKQSQPDIKPISDEHSGEDCQKQQAISKRDITPIASKQAFASTSSRNQRPDRRESAKRARMATSIEDIGSLRLWKGILAEFLGTLLLTMIGCGSCINLRGEANITSPVVQIALCFGLSVATIVWAIGHVSGGHINPAVTVAMLATRKISLAKGAFFVLFQLIGAVVGAGILYGVTPHDYHGNLGATLVNSKLNSGQAIGVEIFITFILVFTVFASVDGKRKDLNGSTPLTIGLSVTMCHLFAIDFTGSSMNTARSFGPAVVIGKWDDHWVYWLGPIIGGVLAGLIYENMFAVNASLEKAKACLLSSNYDDEKYQAQKMKIRILEVDEDDVKEDMPLSEVCSQEDSNP